MAMQKWISAALVSGVLSVGGAAWGQSINVDLAESALNRGAGVPMPQFGGAANQPGFWNVLNTSLDGPVGVLGLDHGPTGISMFLMGSDFVTVLDDLGTSGNVAALLDDSISGFGDVVSGIQLNGLVPGVYRVVVYGFAGGQPDQRTSIIVGDQGFAITGGAWPGHLAEGITHATFKTRVGSTGLFIGAVGGIWGQSGYMNGFQLTLLGGTRCPADMNHDGVLDFADIRIFVTLFLADDLAADLNRDGVLDSGDILMFVRVFMAGC